MIHRKKYIAMLLAGGQGSRLGSLTQNIAKPAVPFGGKYRIIDFTLSNCVNSGIDTVGVLTQYKPLELNDYIGNGQPWGLNRNHGGVHILQPFSKINSKSWYEGTAGAVFQNLRFIERYNPEGIIVLSGDHIYKMDYRKLFAFHEKHNADCTVATVQVPKEETSRFGIVTAELDGKIYHFEEKPQKANSTKASMGIYVFNWPVLKKYLTADNEQKSSSHDFGRNILPAMLRDEKKLYAWEFSGYWKDVGTTESLWEANMDLLNADCPLYTCDQDLRTYARNTDAPPTYIDIHAQVENSMITEGGEIRGRVKCSVISDHCTIEEGALVEHSVLLPGVTVQKGARVTYAIVGQNVVVEADTTHGLSANNHTKPKITVIGEKKKTTAKPA